MPSEAERHLVRQSQITGGQRLRDTAAIFLGKKGLRVRLGALEAVSEQHGNGIRPPAPGWETSYDGTGLSLESKILRARSKAVALAALYICESLLLELESQEILQRKDIEGLLKDAAKTLRAAAGERQDRPDHATAAEIIDLIRAQHELVSN